MTQRSTQWHVNGNVEILLQKKAWRFFQTQREIRKIDPDLIKIDLGIPSEEFLRITILLRIFLFYAVRTSLVEGTGYLYMLTNNYYDRLIVYCVMKKMETIPDIRAKNFFHLCS